MKGQRRGDGLQPRRQRPADGRSSILVEADRDLVGQVIAQCSLDGGGLGHDRCMGVEVPWALI